MKKAVHPILDDGLSTLENAALLQGRHPPPRIHMQTAVATATHMEFGKTDVLKQSIDFVTPQNL